MIKDCDLILKQYLAERYAGQYWTIVPVNGGDSNESYLLSLSANHKLFIKYNNSATSLNMFTAEVASLKEIQQVVPFTPTVQEIVPIGEGAAIFMDYIAPGKAFTNNWMDAGEKIASIHLSKSSHNGFVIPNFIGRLIQDNTLFDKWSSFFIHNRLEPQLKLAIDSGRLPHLPQSKINALYTAALSRMINIQPVLLHGDLWTGNVLFDQDGKAWLVDPACYYGHSEMDLAMTKLFGKFPKTFYTAYHNIIPQMEGQADRLHLYQLYYLLVHLNMFGNSYSNAVTQKIGQLIK